MFVHITNNRIAKSISALKILNVICVFIFKGFSQSYENRENVTKLLFGCENKLEFDIWTDNFTFTIENDFIKFELTFV
jgi:hypothetical protein